MKKQIIFTMLCFALVFTSCQKDTSVDAIQRSNNSIDGISEFEKALKENKIPFSTEDIEEPGEFAVIPEKRASFIIDGERVIVYIFPTFEVAKEYKNQFDIGGCSIGNSKISWAGFPHFYQNWNLIIEYIGYSDEIVEDLESILGKEFSGYYAVGNKSHPKKNQN